ncbi:Hypothetical protein PHPALM_10414 [Phytophthora palmivora]|uniref:Uncharacterized protein n=1 Tax=Phytophthora palmivora TaxID=4796 RepID=A0A2P4Y4U1_9STRA|nr:Hypothetical protein PHPALM_10414 [Phytophthora palmivora]
MATEKAVEMADKDLFTSNSIGLLWKWVIHCGDKSVFDSVTDKFTKAEPSLLGPSIQYLSQYLCANGEDNDKIAMLGLSVCKRVKWLKDEIDVLNKPFTWEMSEAEFPDNGAIPAIQAFLRGPEVSMTTEKVKNFKGYQEAQNYAARIMRFEQDHCSFEMEGTTINAKTFVTITKTRKWFLAQQKQLVQHQTELRLLTDQYGDDLKVDGGDKKRICLDK